MKRRTRRATAAAVAVPQVQPPALVEAEGGRGGSGVPRRRRSRLLPFITKRRAIQVGVGLGLYWAIGPGGVPLSWVIVGGSAAGIVLGKFFCRWMCPMGAVMELMMGAGGEKQRSLYMYMKIGCPIAWAGGWLNKFSLLRIKLRPERCTDCNRCDEACYVAQLSTGRSLHVVGQVNASTDYTCSRCLACVGACPTGALTVGLAGPKLLPDVAGAERR
jgi:polyferredoxin